MGLNLYIIIIYQEHFIRFCNIQNNKIVIWIKENKILIPSNQINDFKLIVFEHSH